MSFLGPYRVLGELGNGGEGAVLLAYDPRLQRRVALKRHRLPRTRLARRRARQEARRLSTIEDPRVTRIFDLIDDGDELLLVMQYVPGCDLEAALAAHRLSTGAALALAGDIAAGLAAAHRHGIVHGDLKAANVLVGEDGRAVLTDFGVAVAAAGGVARGVSVSAWTPEHLRGAPLEPRSDLYALGRLLYRMLAGFDPFPGDTAPERLLAGEYRPVAEAVEGGELPEGLPPLIEALLAPAPEERPANALVVRRQLRAMARALPDPLGRPVAAELAGTLSAASSAAEAPPLLPASLHAASRRRDRRAAITGLLRRPGVRVALGAVLVVAVGAAGWRVVSGPPCVALEPPRVSVAPGTRLSGAITRDWLEASLARAITAQRQLRLTGAGAPGAPLQLTADGPQPACRPRARLGLTVDCRPALCLLRLADAGEVVLFPDAPPARWDRAVRLLARAHYP